MRSHRSPALAAASLLVACAGLAGAQTYDLVIVPATSTLGTPEAYLTDINDSNQVIGWMTHTYQSPPGSFHTEYFVARWTHLGGTEILQPGTATRMNNLGDYLAGGTIVHGGGGSTSPAPISGYPSVNLQDLNDDRTAVGSSIFRILSGCSVSQTGLAWTPGAGTLGLSALGATGAHLARGVNSSNQVVGVTSISGSCGDYKAFTFDLATNQFVNLDALLHPPGPGSSDAVAINDSGTVVGVGWNGTFYSMWTWSPAQGFDFKPGLKLGDRDRVAPSDINNAGHVVGSAATQGVSKRRAFLWTPSQGMRDLNDMLAAPSSFILDSASAINENGWIVGYGHPGPSEFGLAQGFVLIPRSTGCRPDLTTGAVPGQPGYGTPNGTLNNDDFFFYLAQFASGNLAVADLTTGAVPGQPGYGVPNGVLNNDDFFFYLTIFAAGC